MYCPNHQQSKVSVKSFQGNYSLFAQNNSCRVAISFGYTTRQLFEGKSVTRRCWKDSYAQNFIKRWQRGITTYIALDKDRRWGGKQIGWITLTCCPYKQRLSEMPLSDLAAEGFPELNRQEFIERFFKGNDQQQVWVIRFKFTSQLENSCSTIISSNLDAEGNVENSCSIIISSPCDKDCSTRISRKPDEVKVSPTDDKQPPQSDVQRLQAKINKLKTATRHKALGGINETAPQLRTQSLRYQKMLAELEADELDKRRGQIQTLKRKLRRLNSISNKRSSMSVGAEQDSLNLINLVEPDGLEGTIPPGQGDGGKASEPKHFSNDEPPAGFEGYAGSSKERSADCSPKRRLTQTPSATQIQTIRVEQKTADGQAENSHSNQAKMSSTKPFQTIRVEQKTADGGVVDSPTDVDVVESPSKKQFQTIRVEHQPETETAKYPRARNTKPGRGLRPKQVNCNVRRNLAQGKKPDSYWVYKFSFKVDGKYFNRSCSIPKKKVNRVIEMWESKQYCWREIVEYIGKNPDQIIDKARKKED
ncbi:hypothetical protein ACL6C3_14875 [Capilliphycus salinus ALCB114379]|uniref:hypothetical protein n=1 Tax=Capilliphycus salinus TaxID=2768948 RepID=UPI0039A49B00